MKDEIKENNSVMKCCICNNENIGEFIVIEDKKYHLNCITNLQEENEKLKELCDKYEEEHSTTFNEWKETITDKYQILKELQQKTDNQTEEINKLVKQREKFMKKYGYLKEENGSLKELKAELQEEIDSATWWNNRFKAVERENERLKKRNDRNI